MIKVKNLYELHVYNRNYFYAKVNGNKKYYYRNTKTQPLLTRVGVRLHYLTYRVAEFLIKKGGVTND